MSRDKYCERCYGLLSYQDSDEHSDKGDCISQLKHEINSLRENLTEKINDLAFDLDNLKEKKL